MTVKGAVPVAIEETSWLEKKMLEEQIILPTTSIACWGEGLRIPKRRLVESQNKLEDNPKGLDPCPKGR